MAIISSYITFSSGIPQIYYSDSLAQRNDIELYKLESEGRSL